MKKCPFLFIVIIFVCFHFFTLGVSAFREFHLGWRAFDTIENRKVTLEFAVSADFEGELPYSPEHWYAVAVEGTNFDRAYYSQCVANWNKLVKTEYLGWGVYRRTVDFSARPDMPDGYSDSEWCPAGYLALQKMKADFGSLISPVKCTAGNFIWGDVIDTETGVVLIESEEIFTGARIYDVAESYRNAEGEPPAPPPSAVRAAEIAAAKAAEAEAAEEAAREAAREVAREAMRAEAALEAEAEALAEAEADALAAEEQIMLAQLAENLKIEAEAEIEAKVEMVLLVIGSTAALLGGALFLLVKLR
ncbi:hypothetical protein FACS189499_02660 [Clostridia bacterium]|nr:hypothetical protein FACS189499_02660 [Clostridia bacterium]